MSILITGMEMPKSCDDCRIMVFEDTNCVPELYCGCPIVFKAHPQGVDHRPDYCPLVPVQPHGRLIDADAMIENLEFIMKHCTIEGHTAQRCREVIVELSIAPTIIPASKEGET